MRNKLNAVLDVATCRTACLIYGIAAGVVITGIIASRKPTAIIVIADELMSELLLKKAA